MANSFDDNNRTVRIRRKTTTKETATGIEFPDWLEYGIIRRNNNTNKSSNSNAIENLCKDALETRNKMWEEIFGEFRKIDELVLPLLYSFSNGIENLKDTVANSIHYNSPSSNHNMIHSTATRAIATQESSNNDNNTILELLGVGVRIKYHFVKVYAVGTYIDTETLSKIRNDKGKVVAASAVPYNANNHDKEQVAQEILLNPEYKKIVRIVLNRDLTSTRFFEAVTEALKPRMNGQDLWALQSFKELGKDFILPYQSELIMAIGVGDDRSDDEENEYVVTFFSPSDSGIYGNIRSNAFCKALCDVYYGKDSVSPTHREAVIKGLVASL